LFDGFIREQIKTQATAINLVRGGSGDSILLLHGFPQTHVCWHRATSYHVGNGKRLLGDATSDADSAERLNTT
jgi:haloacetate dehalogenase